MAETLYFTGQVNSALSFTGDGAASQLIATGAVATAGPKGDIGATGATGTTDYILLDNKPDLSIYETIANKGAVSGYAPLDNSSLLPAVNARPFNDRSYALASTVYNKWDLVTYRGRKILMTSSYTSNASGFISGANYINLEGENVFRAYDFGFRCDGSQATATANVTALNAAIAAASAIGGGRVIIPSGFAFINATVELKERVWLQGAGMRATTIQLTDAANCTMFKNHVSTTGTSTDKNAQFTAMLDLTLDGRKTSQSSGSYYGIYFATNPNSAVGGDPYFDPTHLVQNVTVINAKSDGIHIDGRSDTRIITCKVTNCDGYGYDSSFDSMFIGCIAEQNGLSGFNFANGNIYATGCKSFLNGQLGTTDAHGFSASGGVIAITITGSISQNNRGNGLKITTMRGVIVQGFVSDSNNNWSGSTTTYAAIDLSGVRSCVIDAVCTQGTQGGVRIGDQINALSIDASSLNNSIRLTHIATTDTTVGTALATGSVVDITNRLEINGTQYSSVDMGNQKIINLATPTSTTDAVTKSYVDTAVTNLVNAAPVALDTLNELAAALGNDANFATTITTSLAGKQPTIIAGTTGQYYRGDKTFQTLDKSAVGLSNVDNTSDITKPVSTAQQIAINNQIGSALLDTWRKRPFLFTDFLNTGSSQIDPFSLTNIGAAGSGSPNAGVSSANHPGILRINSSTTANSGGVVAVQQNQFLLGGGEISETVFRLESLSGTTTRVGFHDTVTSTDAIDGVYIEIDGSGIATGKTASSSTRSTTGTTYTLTVSVWYRMRVTVNSTSLVTFEVFNDSGTLLWTDTLTTNIPTVSGRETGAGFITTNSGTTAVTLAHIDYMAVTWNSDRVR